MDVKVVSKQVGDCQARFKNRKALYRRRHEDTLVLGDGQNGDWTPHDLRRTGATMMQALGVSLDVIDRCQNHVLAGSRVRRHYLHHDYAEEKKRAWDLLGDRLSAVLSSNYEYAPNESMLSFSAYAATEMRPPS
ncbi:integrase [Pseudomonas koreensis]|nr:integrase [Pseudomonas koreensis]